ncbi:hypothetical protein C8R44DRAFT_983555 [Mycena epipterygia]|nr:hypothetical protein C8R44DRAFT_983555 [Mycena epipterygia]
MAPGANYMGGMLPRRAPKTRLVVLTKTSSGRQRLEILSKGIGSSSRAPSGGNLSGYGPRISASDIALSHAKLPAAHLEHPNSILDHPPAHASSPSRAPYVKFRNTSRSSSGNRNSRVLEALDTTEPLAMRAAMNKILSIPDLAGLSTRQNVHAPPRTTSGSKRARPLDLDAHHPRKRQDKSLPMLVIHTPAVQPDNAQHTVDQANKPPSTPVLFETRLPVPLTFNRPSISLSSHSAGLAYSPSPTRSFKRDDPDPRNAKKIILRDNLYDYQDPWNAIGALLGLEEHDSMNVAEHQEPLETLPTEIMDNIEVASAHSQDSSETSDSNHSSMIQRANHNVIDDAAHSLPHSTPAPASPTSQRDTNVAEFSTNICGSSHEDFQSDITSGLDDEELEPPESLGILKYYSTESNPTTPLRHTKIVPSFSFRNLQDKGEIPTEAMPTLSPVPMSPVKSLLPSPLIDTDAPRLPRFAKFPLPLDQNRRTTNHSTYIKNSFAHPKLEFLTPRPPSSNTPRRDQLESFEAVKSPEISQCGLVTSHFEQASGDVQFGDAEVASRTEVEIPRARVDVAENTETESAPSPPPASASDTKQPEKFFGNLCLFSDDIDDPESDD